MLTYQGDRKLEELLESLFDDAISEGIVVWNGPGKKKFHRLLYLQVHRVDYGF